VKKGGRYDVSGLLEAQFEPGSRGRVLRNLLGIVRVGDMRLAESQALWLAQRQAMDSCSDDHRFTAEDIRALHRMWLGPIYPWGGTGLVSAGSFQFMPQSVRIDE
jgi:cell filamentation protein